MSSAADIGAVIVYNYASAVSIKEVEEAIHHRAADKKPIRLIVSSQTVLPVEISWASVVQIVQFGGSAIQLSQYQQYTSLCQAVCATMRHAAAGDIILFAPGACTSKQFRNEQESGDAFIRLSHYFAGIIGTAPLSVVTDNQRYEHARR